MKLLTIKEVMEITQFKYSKSKMIVAKLNKELENDGKITFRGRIDESYFIKRISK